MAYLKEQSAIAAFTIGKEAQIMRLSRHLVQCLYRLVKELAIPLATLSLPNEPTRSLHEQDGPPAGLLWRDILLDLGYASSPSITNAKNSCTNAYRKST
jgi:hypothetical protein